MPYTLRYERSFAAAHQLTKNVHTKACRRLHGHSYRVQIELTVDTLDSADMAVDFGVLKDIIDTYDHRNLNDFFENPTSEVLAKAIYDRVKEAVPRASTIRVTVWESDHSSVTHTE